MENRIDYRVENHIAHVHLIRADKMNALDAEMMDALIEAGERVKADASLRAVVLSGEGRAFCAGILTIKGCHRGTAERGVGC